MCPHSNVILQDWLVHPVVQEAGVNQDLLVHQVNLDLLDPLALVDHLVQGERLVNEVLKESVVNQELLVLLELQASVVK